MNSVWGISFKRLEKANTRRCVRTFHLFWILAFGVTCLAVEDSKHPVPVARSFFEFNAGQASSSVRYLSRRGDGILFVKDREVILQFSTDAESQNPKPPASAKSSVPQRAYSKAGRSCEVAFRLNGSGPDARARGVEPLPGHVNYFLGKDSTGWHTDLETFGAVMCQEVYPGIDWIHYPGTGQLEFDLLIKPGHDPKCIQFEIGGAELISTNSSGALQIRAGGREIELRRPFIYQQRSGEIVAIPGGYVLKDDSHFGFWCGPYDQTARLLIDPVLEYSTLLGGNGDESSAGIAIDAAGNAYVTGWTQSIGFDRGTIFIAKMNSTGTQTEYVSYAGGSDLDQSLGIAVNAAGKAFVVGATQSSDFPVTNAVQNVLKGTSDAVVFELNPNGNQLVYSTYLGGSGSEVDLGFGQILTGGAGIAVDSADNVYVTAATSSSDFPVTANAFQPRSADVAQFSFVSDIFVAKLAAGGKALEYSTYLGGAGLDQSMALAVNGAGEVYLTGATSSLDFPTKNPLQPSPFITNNIPFLTKLNATGSGLVFSTYLSGIGQGNGIALDGAGAIYITGSTSGGLPTTPNAFQRNLGSNRDAFALKLSPAGDTVVYATYLGGGQADVGLGISVNAHGEAVIVGSTRSQVDRSLPGVEFPTRNPIQVSRDNFDQEAFIVKLNSAGDAIYSTFFGGSLDDTARAVAISDSGTVYFTGQTESSDFPLRNAGRTTVVGLEAFVASLSDAGQPITVVDPAAVNFQKRFYRARLLSGTQP